MGGGVQTPPPPAGGGKSRGPAGRGLVSCFTAHPDTASRTPLYALVFLYNVAILFGSASEFQIFTNNERYFI